MMPFGMVGVISFFTHTILGKILRPEYNPITTHISVLTADGAPYADLLRIILYISNICLIIFSAGMTLTAIKKYGALLRIGFCLLFLTSLITIINFGVFPMTMDIILNVKNYMHYLFTTIMMCGIVLSLVLIAIAYNKHGEKRRLGTISTITVILFVFFNLLHMAAILQGWNVLGLVQRLGVYTFYLFIFGLSWIYTRKRIEM